MVQKNEFGYVVKIVAHYPLHPWSRIMARVAYGLSDYTRVPDIISSVGVYTPRFALGSVENPKMVGEGAVDAGITNPPLTAKLAMEGKGLFNKSVGELRAIACFPERDCIYWLVAEELDIHSMEEIAQRKPPLTLVSGRLGPAGPDTLTWTVEEVLKCYGFSYRDIESWGGKVLFPGQSRRGIPVVQRGEANAIFQEGVRDIMWEELAEARRMRCLSLEPSVIEHMKKRYGFGRSIIPKGRLKGIERDTLTLDFGGWLFFCRADLPDELSYLLAKACVEQKDLITDEYEELPPHLQRIEVPLTPGQLCSNCVIPLHPGAERYYREIGCRP